MLGETYEAGGTRIATAEKGTRRRRSVEEEGRQSGKRRPAKGRQEGREREERRREEKEKEGRRCTKSVCKRANYELVRRRPLRVATNKRPALFAVPPEEAPRRRSF